MLRSNDPGNEFRYDEARRLSEQGDWSALLDLTECIGDLASPLPEQHFFRATALLRLGDLPAADSHICNGLSLEPYSIWGRQLKFEVDISLGKVDEAFHQLAAFVRANDDGELEDVKALLVLKAVEFGKFSLAKAINETRSVIQDVPAPPRYAICVQFFNKADTLALTLECLIKARQAKDFALVLIQDSSRETPAGRRYINECAEAEATFIQFLPRLSEIFFSVEFMKNKKNLGTAPTCRRVLDSVCRRYAGFLFIEDDCLLSEDALEWSSFHLRTSIVPEGPWFVTAESIFFDAQDRSIDHSFRDRLTRIARDEAVSGSHVLLDFVPSTCFGTTAELWQRCKSVRSFTRGPESLSAYMRRIGVQTLSPLVPRASDIGMQHPLGYSVGNLGQMNVRESKHTVLMSQGRSSTETYLQYSGDIDLFYSATSLLNQDSISELEKALQIPPHS